MVIFFVVNWKEEADWHPIHWVVTESLNQDASHNHCSKELVVKRNMTWIFSSRSKNVNRVNKRHICTLTPQRMGSLLIMSIKGGSLNGVPVVTTSPSIYFVFPYTLALSHRLQVPPCIVCKLQVWPPRNFTDELVIQAIYRQYEKPWKLTWQPNFFSKEYTITMQMVL